MLCRARLAVAHAAGLVAVTAATPMTAPARTQEHPDGCKANGQAVATNAQAPGAFGTIVRENAPINDQVVRFKTHFCAP